MKYTTSEVVFREIPDEITLAINISNCPIHCPGCHSPELWEDIGKELTPETLVTLIRENPGITCVAFMGGDADPDYIIELAAKVKTEDPELKVAWYSGRESLRISIIYLLAFDYIKLGPYIQEKGPLDNPNTNQRLFMKDFKENGGAEFIDITNKFWENGQTLSSNN